MIDLLHAEAMLTKAGQVEDIVSPKEIFKDYYILFLYNVENNIYDNYKYFVRKIYVSFLFSHVEPYM